MNGAGKTRLKQKEGASLIAALFFFMLCGIGASMLLTSASVFVGAAHSESSVNQKRLAVESAAAFLRDELMREENTVKILEVMVEDSRESEVFDEVRFYYAGSAPEELELEPESGWQEFGFGADESFLDSYIRARYIPMTEIREDLKLAEEEKQLLFSVQAESELDSETLSQLNVRVRLFMDKDYQITAILSDMQTDEEHEEDRCERRLIVPAQVWSDTDVIVETDEEMDEMGNMTDEWTITTTTRLTTICWERGVIEKEFSGAEYGWEK